MRGPLMIPSSIARLSPNTGPPRSRTVSETPHQRRLGLSRSQQVEVGGLARHEQHLRRGRHERMPMCVDQARHQHAPVRRDDPDVGILVDRDRVHRDAGDGVASNQYIGRSRECGTLAIEDADVLKQRYRTAARSRARHRTRCVLRVARPGQECGQDQRPIQARFEASHPQAQGCAPAAATEPHPGSDCPSELMVCAPRIADQIASRQSPAKPGMPDRVIPC